MDWKGSAVRRSALLLLAGLGLPLGLPLVLPPARATTFPLTLEQPAERRLAQGESVLYSIDLSAGQFLRIVVDQQGVDTAETLRSPSGKILERLDLPFGRFGRETLSIVG